MFQESLKFELLCFSSDLGEICHWAKNNIECVGTGYGYFLTNLTDLSKRANNESFQLLCFSYDFDEIWFGADLGLKRIWKELEITKPSFLPTGPSNQSRPVNSLPADAIERGSTVQLNFALQDFMGPLKFFPWTEIHI